MKTRILVTLCVLALAACSRAPGTGSPAQTVPPLTGDEVGDAQVSLTTLTQGTPITYQLTDGVYQKGTDPAGAGYLSIRLLEQMAFGDLNGDGAGDAAALVSEDYGGTGTFVSLVAFVNENGKPVQRAITAIDDRPVVQAVSIQAGLIGLEVTVHSFQDPMCCPSFETRRHYQVHESKLILRDLASKTPTDEWRTITITSPENAQGGGQEVEISGTVTIAPFENTLSYHVVDAEGNELAAGPVQVTAMDMGTPGTFKVMVPLDHVLAGTTAWVEIRDLSAADGSVLAMDSVEVSR